MDLNVKLPPSLVIVKIKHAMKPNMYELNGKTYNYIYTIT